MSKKPKFKTADESVKHFVARPHTPNNLEIGEAFSDSVSALAFQVAANSLFEGKPWTAAHDDARNGKIKWSVNAPGARR